MKSAQPKYLIIPRKTVGKIYGHCFHCPLTRCALSSKALRSKETIKGPKSLVTSVSQKDANISNANAIAVLNAVMNLILQRQRYLLNDEQLLDDLKAGLQDNKDLDDETKGALCDLLSESEEGYLVEKAESLKTGFFFTFCVCAIHMWCTPLCLIKTHTHIEGILLVFFF